MRFLNRFQNNAEMRDAVKGFLIETVKAQATTKLFAGESVTGYREAILVIEDAFIVLDTTYAEPE